MRQILTIVAALIAGFAGGVFGARMKGTDSMRSPDEVVRAHSFELVNNAGQAISFWGIDQGENVVLAFGRGDVQAGAHSGNVNAELKNPQNQLAAFGIVGDSPMLKMSGNDLKTRVRLYLSDYGKPFLLMEDETGPRLSLGIEQSDTPGPDDNNWTLLFLPERARIGMFTEKEEGQTYVRGVFLVNRDKVKHQ